MQIELTQKFLYIYGHTYDNNRNEFKLLKMGWFEFFKQQVPIAHVSNIPVRIDLRWFFVVLLMTWLTASNLVGARLIDNYIVALLFGLITTLVLFLSIFIHEYAHAWVARLERVEVVEIVLHPFGGLARFRREPDTPRAEFRIAIAGPIASFVLAIVFAAFGALAASAELRVFSAIGFFLALWNFLIAVFNMFPGYPLDGGRVLRAYLWRRGTDLNEATLTTGRYGQIIGGSLMVFGVIILATSKDGLFSGFWTIVVGFFLFDAARGIIREVNDFENMHVEEAMQIPIAIEPGASVQKLVDEFLPVHRRTVYLVAEKKQLHGVVMLEDLKTIPRETWRETQISAVMRPVEPEHFVETRSLLADAKILMRENGIGAVGVVNGQGELVGYLQRGRLRKRN